MSVTVIEAQFLILNVPITLTDAGSPLPVLVN